MLPKAVFYHPKDIGRRFSLLFVLDLYRITGVVPNSPAALSFVEMHIR